MHEVIMPDVLQIGMFKLLHGWITIICYLFTFKLLEVLFVDTMIQVAVMGHWWRYHQCHCRRRQQCLLKLYNLERLNPELCHWRLQCYVWEYYRISFQLSYNYYYFSAEHPWAGSAWEWEVRTCFVEPTMALVSRARSIEMPVHHASALTFPQWNMMGIK